jgi:hypothetical protein
MTYVHQGYIALTGKSIYNHPLTKNSILLEHRKVLYDYIGPGTHNCNWCNKNITWLIDLEVDHLDFNKQNNDIENLVATCKACNMKRSKISRSTISKQNDVGNRLVEQNRNTTFTCCGKEFIGIGRYRAHKRWNCV